MSRSSLPFTSPSAPCELVELHDEHAEQVAQEWRKVSALPAKHRILTGDEEEVEGLEDCSPKYTFVARERFAALRRETSKAAEKQVARDKRNEDTSTPLLFAPSQRMHHELVEKKPFSPHREQVDCGASSPCLFPWEYPKDCPKLHDTSYSVETSTEVNQWSPSGSKQDILQRSCSQFRCVSAAEVEKQSLERLRREFTEEPMQQSRFNHFVEKLPRSLIPRWKQEGDVAAATQTKTGHVNESTQNGSEYLMYQGGQHNSNERPPGPPGVMHLPDYEPTHTVQESLSGSEQDSSRRDRLDLLGTQRASTAKELHCNFRNSRNGDKREAARGTEPGIGYPTSITQIARWMFGESRPRPFLPRAKQETHAAIAEAAFTSDHVLKPIGMHSDDSRQDYASHRARNRHAIGLRQSGLGGRDQTA
ncbi:hypothetical protein BU25DRAFT_271270 [Macroventuria anomochaeta]|uniref:Uncharacterized protein n=1 Tax=Macroventuria anomochaeta TaxID=301207 RepID=A0ACB6S6L7_9PLEO|nr:uncharacterized protein BU25DRAFT_271270 [Macroventuria anomochaeta]KAF2629657.1 hypothetical protein BU25DRAFT_271270 [Macroventuria anomochaeta]